MKKRVDKKQGGRESATGRRHYENGSKGDSKTGTRPTARPTARATARATARETTRVEARATATPATVSGCG